MLAVCGIVNRNGRVLVCKRPSGSFFSGRWEFPTEVLENDEVLEDALERGVFERLSVRIKEFLPLGAVNLDAIDDCRLFGFQIKLEKNFVQLYGYGASKWVKVNELRKYLAVPESVMFVNFKKKTIKNVR